MKMKYTSDEQDNSKSTLKSFKPLFEQTSNATKGIERVMNSPIGNSELIANQPSPAGTIPSEIQLKNATFKGSEKGDNKDEGGGGRPKDNEPKDEGSGGGGTGGGRPTPVADEQEVEAELDYYDRLRLWFKQKFGYRIKEGKDIFDWLRTNAEIINVGLFAASIIASVLLLIKKKYVLGIAVAFGLTAMKMLFPVVRPRR